MPRRWRSCGSSIFQSRPYGMPSCRTRIFFWRSQMVFRRWIMSAWAVCCHRSLAQTVRQTVHFGTWRLCQIWRLMTITAQTRTGVRRGFLTLRAVRRTRSAQGNFCLFPRRGRQRLRKIKSRIFMASITVRRRFLWTRTRSYISPAKWQTRRGCGVWRKTCRAAKTLARWCCRTRRGQSGRRSTRQKS